MRTRTVFFAVSGVFLTLIAATLGSYWWATATQSGRDFVARTAEQQLESLVRGRGKFTIGEVAELRLDRIVLRNVVVTDSNANKVITAGYLYGEISVRALLDRRIHLRELAVRDFTVAMEKGLTGPWNLVRIFFGEEELVPGPHEPGFGDDVRIDLLTLENGAVSIDIPWEPSARIPASMRDSVIELHRSLHDIRDAAGGMIQHTALSLVRAVANSAIFVSPDGSPASLEIDTLVGAISDPPATIMQAHGRLAWTSDSLNLALSAVQLPASTGKAEGVLWWTDPGPVRFDVTLSADAGLEDLAWIWDVMPESGRAHAQVRMRTLADAEDVEYSLTGLEVNSGGSSVHGRVTVTVTPLDLTLSELDLEFTPLETELARRLSYDAVPPEVRGLIRGRLVASKGGPLTDLLIDRMDARFTDRNADGAVSSLSASGRVSLGVEPSARSTVIHSAEIDLRSVAALTDAIPTGLDGILEASGVIRRASLDGAELTGLTVSWVDGAGNITNVAGDVTAMFGSHRRFVDANIRFDPLSVRALARLDTSIHVYSAISGDLEVKGPLDSLVWKTNLSVPSAGRITASGRGSIQDGRWKAQGSSRFETFDVAEWAGRSDLPGTSLSGTLGFTAGGRSNTSGAGVLDGLSGDIRVTQDGSLYRPAFNFFAGMRLDDERLSVDSARVTMGGSSSVREVRLPAILCGAVKQ